MKLIEKIKQIFLKVIDWFLTEPKRLVRLIVLSICSVVVFFQLWECVMKLLHPPISTHSHFDMNVTMHYPAVTFCRQPAFKADVMEKYNLSYHPSFTSSWRNFSFDSASMADLYDEATYTKEEYFKNVALNGKNENIEILSSMHYSMGRCFTLTPKVTTEFPWKRSGYSINLRDDFDGAEQLVYESEAPGYHVYIHEPREKFTEHGILSSGRIEYLFLEGDEEMELKLTVQHFTQLRGRGSSCSDDEMKSTSVCSEMCRWRSVEDIVSCSGPWITKARTPQCRTYEDVKNLMVQYKYQSDVNNTACGCLEPCYSIIYSAFVMNRKRYRQSDPGSQIYIYYTSKMITNIEERPGYDSSQFVADMGGSLGFLLGLSVIGLIVVLEKLLGVWFLNDFIEKYKAKKEKKLEAEKKSEKVNIKP